MGEAALVAGGGGGGGGQLWRAVVDGDSDAGAGCGWSVGGVWVW